MNCRCVYGLREFIGNTGGWIKNSMVLNDVRITVNKQLIFFSNRFIVQSELLFEMGGKNEEMRVKKNKCHVNHESFHAFGKTGNQSIFIKQERKWKCWQTWIHRGAWRFEWASFMKIDAMTRYSIGKLLM